MPKYQIFRTRNFSKSLKRLLKSGNFDRSKLDSVVEDLEYGRVLPIKNHDHALVGDWLGYRECHIESDLLLIYEVDNDIVSLILFDIGSHSYLFNK